MNGQINVVEKWIVFVFPFLALVFFWKMKINEPKLYFELVQEDQLLEQMQFLFYLVASLIALRVAWLFRTAGITLHAVLYFGLFAVLLLVAFEEISWGQRIFGIESPQYFVEHNLQKELNLHNLVVSAGALHKAYLLLGLFGCFAWLGLVGNKSEPMHILRFVFPPWYISSWFFPVLLVYGLFEYLTSTQLPWFRQELMSVLIWRDQEPVETLLSAGFLLFAWRNHRRLELLLSRR